TVLTCSTCCTTPRTRRPTAACRAIRTSRGRSGCGRSRSNGSATSPWRAAWSACSFTICVSVRRSSRRARKRSGRVKSHEPAIVLAAERAGPALQLPRAPRTLAGGVHLRLPLADRARLLEPVAVLDHPDPGRSHDLPRAPSVGGRDLLHLGAVDARPVGPGHALHR